MVLVWLQSSQPFKQTKPSHPLCDLQQQLKVHKRQSAQPIVAPKMRRACQQNEI